MPVAFVGPLFPGGIWKVSLGRAEKKTNAASPPRCFSPQHILAPPPVDLHFLALHPKLFRQPHRLAVPRFKYACFCHGVHSRMYIRSVYTLVPSRKSCPLAPICRSGTCVCATPRR